MRSHSPSRRTLQVVPPPPDVAAAPPDAKKTTSGLASKVIKPAPGAPILAKADLVTVHYTGWTTDGKMFDSSVARGKPATFPLDRVIAGWTEGVQLMVAGEKRRLLDSRGARLQGADGDPKGMLVFDVELLKFTRVADQAPADVKKAPADAKRTSSGLAYKVLKPGTGTQHPKASSTVTVHYSGWTTDGKLFDSSVMRGEAEHVSGSTR